MSLHVVFCLSIIILILVQYGKGAEAGASFNSASQTFFGSKGTKSFLVKLTTTISILFFINCFIIGLLNKNIQSKNIDNLDRKDRIMFESKKNTNTSIEDIPIEDIRK